MLVSDMDRARIVTAIRQAESRTSGQIVCVLARSSSDYAAIPLIWAAAVALALPWPLIEFTPWSVQRIFALQLVVFLLLALVLSIPALRMALVPRRVRRLRAHRAAAEQFLIRNVSRTEGRTGILIYVSLAERYARILADTGIGERVRQPAWDRAMADLLTACRHDRVADGFLAAIAHCGAILAEHFPPRASGGNELPDRLYVI
jgi:putative membrane protein